MRCYQPMGLTEEARNFLNEKCLKKPSLICPDCGKIISESIVSEEIDKIEVFYDDGPTLHKYKMKDGSEIIEVIQASPWSSGPVVFLCLKDPDGKTMFEWPQEEIDNC